MTRRVPLFLAGVLLLVVAGCLVDGADEARQERDWVAPEGWLWGPPGSMDPRVAWVAGPDEVLMGEALGYGRPEEIGSEGDESSSMNGTQGGLVYPRRPIQTHSVSYLLESERLHGRIEDSGEAEGAMVTVTAEPEGGGDDGGSGAGRAPSGAVCRQGAGEYHTCTLLIGQRDTVRFEYHGRVPYYIGLLPLGEVVPLVENLNLREGSSVQVVEGGEWRYSPEEHPDLDPWNGTATFVVEAVVEAQSLEPHPRAASALLVSFCPAHADPATPLRFNEATGKGVPPDCDRHEFGLGGSPVDWFVVE